MNDTGGRGGTGGGGDTSGTAGADGAGSAGGRGEEDDPGEVQRLHSAVRVLWWLEAALLALPFVAGAVVLDSFVGSSMPWPRWLLTGAVTALSGAVVAIVPVLRYRTYAYALREDDLWIRSGVLWRRVAVIPYMRLQFVDTRQGPVERLLGLSQLVVHTAAVGTSGHLPGLRTAAAHELRERLGQLEGDTGGL